MITKRSMSPIIKRLTLAAIVTLSFGFLAVPALSADGIDPDADKISKSMSSYLGGLSAFSMNADIDNEIIDLAGQKLQLSSGAEIIMERPGKFYIHRQGAYADAEIMFDGKSLTIHGMGKNVYMQVESPGNIDNAFNTMENPKPHPPTQRTNRPKVALPGTPTPRATGTVPAQTSSRLPLYPPRDAANPPKPGRR